MPGAPISVAPAEKRQRVFIPLFMYKYQICNSSPEQFVTGECSRAGFKENAIIGEGAMKGKQVVSALSFPPTKYEDKIGSSEVLIVRSFHSREHG